MASRPKVPFALHESLTLVKNLDVGEASHVALSPDARTAALVHGPWGARRLSTLSLATGDVTDALAQPANVYFRSPAWSPDGRRWAVVGETYEGDEMRGVIHVGEGAAVRFVARTEQCRQVTRNAQSRPAPEVAWSPDGARLVQRSLTADERCVLFHIDAADGAVRAQWLDEGECDVYAATYDARGRLWTVSGDPGDRGGLLCFDGDAPAVRSPWVFGVVIAPTATGVWVVGQPGYCFFVDGAKSRPVRSAARSRAARADALRMRAKSSWDVTYLDRLVEDHDPSRRYCYHPTRDSFRVENAAPRPGDGARCFENDTLWESALAAAVGGGDDVAVSDGVGVWRWRATDDGLAQTLLIDDTQRGTHRNARLMALSAAGDTLALLWKKDQGGKSCVLSVFTLR